MSLLGIKLEEITTEDLRRLIDYQIRESRAIEYKRQLPDHTKEARFDLLTTVASLANSGGGDIVYGVAAANGVPQELTPFSFDPDQDALRWEQIIREKIAPRLTAIRLRAIAVGDGHVLIMRVPASWASPHAVLDRTAMRFYARTSVGKYPLDITELRGAFMASAEAGSRIARFRTDRLAKISSGETPIPLQTGRLLIVHVAPIQPLSPETPLDLNAVRSSGLLRAFGGAAPNLVRWNLDGLVASNWSGQDTGIAYVQLFRTGEFEFVDGWSPGVGIPDFRDGTMHGCVVERAVIDSVARAIDMLETLGSASSCVVMVTLQGVRGLVLAEPSSIPVSASPSFGRDTIRIPDLLVEPSLARPGTELRPVLDMIWQAAGQEYSPNFTPIGDWRRSHPD